MNATFVYECSASLKAPGARLYICLMLSLAGLKPRFILSDLAIVDKPLSSEKSPVYLVVIKTSQISSVPFSKRPPPQ